MCGIVGYVGNKNAQQFLISGLRRLEYRGYDSAGVVTLSQEGLATLLREKGKVSELAHLVSVKPKDDLAGIGHTRWATHGQPSKKNAHPHKAGDIYLVHNGIIENYAELKAELRSKHKFMSDTDSEVLAALINSFFDKDTELLSAVNQALKLVKGTYGIVVVSVRNPNELVAARSGSPLIIGVGDDEVFIASDASAIIGHTSQAIYLEDGEIAVCRRDDVYLFDLESQPITPQVEKIETDLQAIQKQGYDHFLLKEIFEQPKSLRSTLSGRLMKDEARVKLGGLNLTNAELQKIEHIVIVGCGTAYYAGLLSSYYLEKLVDEVTVDVVVASEFRYRSFYLPKNTVALVVSQSGETADTLACLREIKRRGVKTLGIINAVGSTIAREVDGGIYVHAGPEISVASTKAFTSQASSMILFGLRLAEVKGKATEELKEYIDELFLLPQEIEELLKKQSKIIQRKANNYAQYDHALYLGRDTAYPVALEGALKLKEISYIQAEGYATGELKHGPIALIDNRFFEVFLLPDDWLMNKSLSGLQEIKARGANVLVVTNANTEIDADVIRIKTKLHKLTPLLLNVVLQVFAYYIAVKRGTDVDQPRNLAKSVTVE